MVTLLNIRNHHHDILHRELLHVVRRHIMQRIKLGSWLQFVWG